MASSSHSDAARSRTPPARVANSSASVMVRADRRAAFTHRLAARATASAATDPPAGAGSGIETRPRNSSSERWRYSGSLAESNDLAVLVDVDALGRRVRRQPRHGAHVAADQVDEPRADRRARLANRHTPPGGRAVLGRVRGDAEVRLGDDDGQLAEALLLVVVQLAPR